MGRKNFPLLSILKILFKKRYSSTFRILFVYFEGLKPTFKIKSTTPFCE